MSHTYGQFKVGISHCGTLFLILSHSLLFVNPLFFW